MEDAEDPAEDEGEGGSDSDGCSGEEGSESTLLQPPSLAASLSADAPSRERQPALSGLEAGSSSDEDTTGPGGQQQGAAAGLAAGSKGKRAVARAATACKLCGKAASRTWVPCACGVRTHVECLARHFLQAERGGGDSDAGGMPARGACPGCGAQQTWMEALGSTQNAGWENKSGRRGRRGATKAAADPQQPPQQQEQGSPTESAPAPVRKPRGHKPKAASVGAAEAAAAAAQAAGSAAGVDAGAPAPAKPRRRPRKLQPLLGGTDGSGPSSGTTWLQQGAQPAQPARPQDVQQDACLALEALPWEDFGLSSPAALGPAASPSPRGGGSGSRRRPRQQRQAEQGGEVVELLDSDGELGVPLARRLAQAPQQRPGGPGTAAAAAAIAEQGGRVASPSPTRRRRTLSLQQPDQQAAACSTTAPAAPAMAGAGPAAAGQPASVEVDLVSPSPLPLRERLRRQQQADRQGGGMGISHMQAAGGHSPRATPSPAPLRKVQRRCSAELLAGSAAGAAAALAAAAQAPALENAWSEAIVISDSE